MVQTLAAGRPGNAGREEKKVAVHGAATVRFEHRHGETRLATLYHHDPLRVLMPAPRRGDLPVAVLATTSGGMVGGDRMDIALSAGPGAKALVTTQAAEKVYRSTGEDCRIDTAVSVEDGAWLEWMPQEAIVFEGARLRRLTKLDLSGDGRAVAGEMLVFGRAAFGETVTRGLIRDAWEVARDGRLIWADALHLEDDIAEALAHPAGFGGAGACATLLHAAAGAGRHLEAVRALAERVEGARVGATAFEGLLVVRILGGDARAVRRAYAAIWSGLRAEAAGLPTRLPRLWEV
ncbi:urease accessory protein UreD [Azospirillum picis]|uniref:Urease accessory protein UreD n=1 Tax=Azospirillum picis TaxID=488438 RepID=A0ABU0MJ45_9PROT|nr:urease accessory protein UreD [Azospirillum picis]MBP2299594.1 urease accessory protein [Azospirillum picis]MDQ0533279.1 urease accessory protein [Azospirillum picis]